VAPRPGGDFIATGKSYKKIQKLHIFTLTFLTRIVS
jgi:hypothetical protein